MIEITQEEYKELVARSEILSQIEHHTEDFIKYDDDTTLIAVLRLISQYYFLQSDKVHNTVLRLRNEL